MYVCRWIHSRITECIKIQLPKSKQNWNWKLPIQSKGNSDEIHDKLVGVIISFIPQNHHSLNTTANTLHSPVTGICVWLCMVNCDLNDSNRSTPSRDMTDPLLHSQSKDYKYVGDVSEPSIFPLTLLSNMKLFFLPDFFDRSIWT